MPNTIISTIKDIIVILAPIALAWIGYKQSKMASKQNKMDEKQTIINTQIDGMKTELVAAVKGRGEAEGELTGIAKAKEEAAVIIKTSDVQEVKIVEQSKPIDVKIDKSNQDKK